MTEDDVQQKIEDAEKYAEEDKAKKESVEIHNNLDSVIWQTESMLEENKEKATEDVVQELEKAIESAKSALGLEDIDTKKTAIEDLQKAAMAFAQTIQPEPGGSEDVSGEQASDQENEEVIEGEE